MALLNPTMRDKRKVKGSNPAVFMTDQTFEGDKLGGNGGGTDQAGGGKNEGLWGRSVRILFGFARR